VCLYPDSAEGRDPVPNPKQWLLLFKSFVRPDLWVTLCDADTPVDASGKRIAKSVRQGARQSFHSKSMVPGLRVQICMVPHFLFDIFNHEKNANYCKDLKLDSFTFVVGMF
jgi:hypothetical protein